jgi:hypothetical protein
MKSVCMGERCLICVVEMSVYRACWILEAVQHVVINDLTSSQVLSPIRQVNTVVRVIESKVHAARNDYKIAPPRDMSTLESRAQFAMFYRCKTI